MASPRSLVVDAYNSLSRDVNKAPGRTSLETEQGVVSELMPELSVEMPNDKILAMLTKAERAWTGSAVYAEWIKRRDENNNYWLGKHFQRPETDKTRALVDNVIFEAVETSIPQYIGRDPEPAVKLARGEDPSLKPFADELQQELGDIGEEIDVRAKLKKVARHWMLNLVGIGKYGWDVQRNIPMMKVIRPTKAILDPDATVDEDGYTGELVGEYRALPAYKILKFVTEDGAREPILALVKDDQATMVQFVEWWSDKVLVWSLGEKDGGTILMKRRNPHWNYDEEATDIESDHTPVGIAPEGSPAIPQLPEASEAPEAAAPGRPTMPVMSHLTSGLGGGDGPSQGVEQDGAPVRTDNPVDQGVAGEEGEEPQESDEDGAAVVPPPQVGVNHFAAPRKPYSFLVMLNLGDQPVDNTSFITQNLSNQDMINKRMKQIDKNADNMNNGLVVSLERSGLTAQQAKGVTEALRKGGVVGIPMGAPQEAVWRPETPGLPADVYNNAVDLRNRVKGIFGINGSSAAPTDTLDPGQPVRGIIANKLLDTDRMGGGINEVIERFADEAYNWFVQLKYVYDQRYLEMAQQAGGRLPKVRVSIKEGSLLPKDKTSLANQAVALGAKGMMAAVDVYKALDYPNPEEMAVNAWLQANAPDLLYPNDQRVQQAVQRQAQAAVEMEKMKHPPDQEEKPSQSISFKDLPPEGKSQMAAKVGISLHPEGIAAHDQLHNPPPSLLPPPNPPAP